MVRLLPLFVLLWAFGVAAAVGNESQPKSAARETAVTVRIDSLIRRHWEEFSVVPSEAATDGEWARRVFLDLVGRIPTVPELNAFRRDRRRGRKAKLVRRLLHGEQYAGQLARNWATIWTNLLIGRSGGTERDSLINRAGMESYLLGAFMSNQRYDAMVVDLLTAEGANKQGEDDFNGAVNFLSMKLSEKGAAATADSARIFLGKQVQCTQCHDHPFNEWKQHQFWELNSFFRQTVALRRFDADSGMVSYVSLTDQDFAGEGNTPDDAEVYFEHRDATVQAAYPAFIDGTQLENRSGRLKEVHRRKELAKLIVHSDEMPRAIVNRMWGHFFTYGFTTPLDDMGPHNPPTHPELLDFLAKQFRAHDFDLRLLMEWITLSEAYSLSSRMTKHNQPDDPSKGNRPLFSHFYTRQLRPEQLYDSLITSTRVDRTESQLSRERWLTQFAVEDRADGVSSGTFDGSISQSLVLFNGELTRLALAESPSNMLFRLATLKTAFDKKIDQLFMAAVARHASSAEKAAAKQLLRLRDGNVFECLRDLWWAILNSNEFILNH